MVMPPLHNWLTMPQVLLEHRKDVKLEGIVSSKDFLAVFHRTNGLQARTLVALDDAPAYPMQGILWHTHSTWSKGANQ